MAIFKKIRGTIESIFQLGLDGQNIKSNGSAVEIRDSDDTSFATLRAGAPSGDNDVATKFYVDSVEGITIVDRQADTSSSLPNNTSTRGFLVVTTAGSGAAIGDLLFDNGLNDAQPVSIVSAKDGRTISTTASFTGGTISLEADSVYTWDDTGGEWVKIGDIGSVTGAVRTIRFTLDNTASQDSSSEIPSGYRVIEARIEVTTPYSGGATIEMGDTSTSDLIFSAGDAKEQKADTYIVEQDTAWPSDSVVRVTVGGTPAAGAGVAIVKYANPNG